MNRKEMELCLIFELQWKDNPGEKAASMGVWDKEENPALDWTTFKSYVGQNLGTLDDISVAYIDSEGDEIPIDSECEFQEALRFAWKQARNNKETIIRVDKISSAPVNVSNGNVTTKDNSSQVKMPKRDFPPSLKFAQIRTSCRSDKCGCASKSKVKSFGSDDKIKNSLDKLKYYTSKKDEDEPPKWFKMYMKKFKSEMMEDIKLNVSIIVRQALKKERRSVLKNNSNEKIICISSNDNKSKNPTVGNVAPPIFKQKQKQKQKKASDEESSDANLVTPQKDVKLLKKIEKLHRSGEKKFEKLDSKLEKLENKTKRLLEKKSQSKSRSEKKDKSVETVDKGIKQRKKSSDISFTTCLMDAVLLDTPSSVIHCSPGEQFVKVWNIMNRGSLRWTDKTELCLSWGTPGMKFEKKMIKCPQLIPGEKGRIKVKAVAPDYPGTFESYWHFYHMGERFGHWIDCAVIVDGNHEIRFKHQACENTRNIDFDYLNNCNEKFEGLGNEEKIKLKMAELTQKLNGLQIELSQNKRCCMNEERKDQCNSDSLTNSVGSDAMKENQRKIAENMVEIQKRLDDISLLHSPPTANKILEMAFGDEFVCKKDSVEDVIVESDNTDEIDLDQITGKNIEPAEWKILQLHPEFLKSCDLLREVQIRDEAPAKEEGFSDEEYAKNERKISFEEIFRPVVMESKDLMDCIFDNDLNKQQDVSDTFSKNIEADQIFEDKKENVEVEEETAEANEKNLEYESDSDSELSIMSFSMFSSSSESDDESRFIVVPAPSGTHSPDCKTYPSSEGSEFQDIKVINEAEPVTIPEPEEPQNPASVEASAPPVNEFLYPTSFPLPTYQRKPVTYAKDSKGQTVWAVSSEGVCMPALDEESYNNKLREICAYTINKSSIDCPIYRPRRARLEDDDDDCTDEENESKTKKLKSSRPSEYHFNAAEIPEKTLKLNEEAPSTFTFTAGKEEKKERPCCSNCGYKPGEKRDKNGNTGKKGYNRHNGYNVNFGPAPGGQEKVQQKIKCPYCERFYGYEANLRSHIRERHPGAPDIILEDILGKTSGKCAADIEIPSVDHLPSPLLNGVLNVASTAFSTARTVLNNIKMPPMHPMPPIPPTHPLPPKRPMPPMKTECSEGAKEKSRPSIEALCKLYEMGFKNVQANQKFLEMYDNDVNKVIDELLNPKQ